MNSKKYSSTIDQNEQEKFDRLGKDWWNVKGPMQALHEYNFLRIDFLRRTLKIKQKNSFNPFSNMRFLDVGCGGGILTEPLKRLGAEIIGLDSNANLIKIASDHAKNNSLNITYINRKIENYFPNKKFDVILCMEVLEHVSNLEIFLNEIKRLLKYGGFFVGSTINKSLSSLFLAKITAEYILNLLPKGTHSWDKFITPKKLSQILKKKKFGEFKEQGTFYNPLLKKWSFTTFKKVNYLFSVQKIMKKV